MEISLQCPFSWSSNHQLGFRPGTNLILQQDGKVFTYMQKNLQMNLWVQRGVTGHFVQHV